MFLVVPGFGDLDLEFGCEILITLLITANTYWYHHNTVYQLTTTLPIAPCPSMSVARRLASAPGLEEGLNRAAEAIYSIRDSCAPDKYG